MSFDPFGDFEVAGYLQSALQLKDPDLQIAIKRL